MAFQQATGIDQVPHQLRKVNRNYEIFHRHVT